MNKIILIFILLFSLTACNSYEKEITESSQKSVELSVNSSYEDTNYSSVGVNEFSKGINNRTNNDVILDVRTQEEFNQGYIDGAILLDYYKNNFKEHLSLLDKNKTYYIYCRSGNRSGKTLKMMKDLGFNKVIDLDKGIIEWNDKNLPLENNIISNVVLHANKKNNISKEPIHVNISTIEDKEFEINSGFTAINLPTMYGFEFESEGFTFYFDGGYKKYGEKHIGFGPQFVIPESPTDIVIKGHAYEMKLIEKDENFYGEIIKLGSNDVYYKSHGGMCDLRTYVLKGKIKDIKISSSGCNTTKEEDDTYMKTIFGNFIKINK